jgi:DNA-binding response OmpR family regulator
MAPAPGEFYTITLDDDLVVHKMIAKATGIASLPFVSQKSLAERMDELDPMAAFVDMHLGPEENGLDVIPSLRLRWPFCPILVVTSDAGDAAIGEALAAGANDFIRKPISGKEVLARLNARVREMAHHQEIEQISIGDVVFNRRLGTLSGRGVSRHLTPKEMLMFESIASAKGMMITRKDLKRRVWGDTKVSDNAFDKLLHKLRSALRDASAELSIEALYGAGVALRVATSSEEATA